MTTRTTSPAASGAYKLSIDPPEPRVAGDTCADALAPTLEVTSGDYIGSGDISTTGGLTDNFDGLGCGGFAWSSGELVNDQVWRFVAPDSDTWTLTVSPGNDSDPLAYALTSPCEAEACLGDVVDAGFGGDPETLSLGALAAGEEVFVVIDAWSPDAAGPYKVRFSRACAPTCTAGRCGEPDGCGGTCGCADGQVCQAGACIAGLPGDSCDSPQPLETHGSRYKGLGDLSAPGVTDARDLDGCSPLDDTFPASGAGTPDQFWTFAVSSSGPYTIKLTPLAGADLLFALFKGTGCAAGACFGYVDVAARGGVERLDADLTAGVPYSVMVDTWDADDAGAYTIEVEPACVPRCDLSSCGGDDGCGGVCGCGPGDRCDLGLCLPNKGDTCLFPYHLTEEAGTFLGAGDLLGPDVGDDFQRTDCPLLDGFANTGAGTADEFFNFEITEPADYTITVTSVADTDVFFAVLSGPCDDSTCLGTVDNGISGESDKITMKLEPGPHTLVVDNFEDELGAGPYTVSIRKAACVGTCAPGSCADDGCGRPCACAPNEFCDSTSLSCKCAPVCPAGSCGSDGCGGTCPCGGGQVCGPSATCVDAPGASCASALRYRLGTQAAGDTTGAFDAQDGLNCPGSLVSGVDQPDLTHVVKLPFVGKYTFTLTPDTGADLSLYAYGANGDRCGDQCLVGSEAAPENGVESITLLTTAERETAYLVVDGATRAGRFLLESSTSIDKCAGDLFISEYVEGSGLNKAIEIANFTGSPINLTGYSVVLYANGAVAATATLNLTGTLAHGDTYVICNPSIALTADQKTAICDAQNANVANQTGDDAIELRKNGTVIDTFGRKGEDPGTGWTLDGQVNATADRTLVRLPTTFLGTSDWAAGGAEWLFFPKDALTELGAHDYFWGCTPPAPAPLANCNITFESATCPSAATAMCGVNFSGGACKVIGIGTCYTSGVQSYEVKSTSPVNITFGGPVTRARAFVSGQIASDAGQVEFFDASGNSVGKIVENGTCSASEPPRQCVTLTGPATRATATATSGVVWIDDFEVNPANCP